jgi:hypothetical protein
MLKVQFQWCNYVGLSMIKLCNQRKKKLCRPFSKESQEERKTWK